MRKKINIYKLLVMIIMLVFPLALPAEAFQYDTVHNYVFSQEKSDIRILLHGERLVTEIPFFIEGGRTLIPVRFFLETMGADVSWHSSTKSVSVARGDTSIEMVAGEKKALINGSPVTLEVPLRLIENRAYVPLRFIAESLGVDIGWNDAERLILIEFESPEGAQQPPPYYQDLNVQVETYGISLGDSGQAVLDLLGEPARRDDTIYGYCWWGYNQDYRNYLQVGIKDGSVVAIYTPGQGWAFGPLQRGCGLNLLEDSFEIADRLFVEEEKVIYELYLPTLVYENLVATFYCDEQDKNKIVAVRLEDREVAEDRFNLYYKYRFPQGKRDSFDREKMRKAEAADEKQIFDLANMERLLRGLPALSWNRDAALAALEHSREMYIHNYFDHFSPVTGEGLDYRLDRRGVNFILAAENIARGQFDGVEVHHGLMNSLRHRENILHKDLRSLGVGVYGDCYTQNFVTLLE